MQRRLAGAQCIAPLFLLLSLVVACTLARAQELPTLEATPSTVGTGGVLTLSVSIMPQGRSTQRVALYEHLRPTKIAEVKKNFALTNGRWSTQLRIEAEPGSYDIRLVSDDKNRTVLSADVTILIPGIIREPGWWLINGSPFIQASHQNASPASVTAPLFIAGLKRDGKKFERKVITTSGEILEWRVLYLPDTNQLLKPDFDFGAWRTKVQTAVHDAQQRGERNLLGIVLRVPLLVRETEQATNIGRQVRKIVNEIAPDAPLILEISEDGHDLHGRAVSAWASFCDAVIVQRNPWRKLSGSTGGWPIKVVRRVAEEQPQYDLPIFVATTDEEQGEEVRSVPSALNHELNPATQLLRYWISGASGALTLTSVPIKGWREVVMRNSGLFIGSATLEDVGIWPPTEMPAPQDIENFYNVLVEAGRIPLMARIQQKKGDKIPESFMTILGDEVSAETIEKLHIAAKDGARIYLEGAPKLIGDAATVGARWSTLVGAASTPVEKKQATMALDDSWIFGTARGQKVLIEQSVKVGALHSPVKRTKKDEPEKGQDILIEPRVLATLQDGSPALIENPVGDGEVLWSPHRVLTEPSNVKVDKARLDYYNSIASFMQGALVQVQPAVNDGKTHVSTPPACVVVRRSPKGTWLIGLFNDSGKSTPVTVEANHYADVALNLQTEKELPLTMRGNRSTITTTIPESGWQIIALGETREKLDLERFAPRTKAKLR